MNYVKSGKQLDRPITRLEEFSTLGNCSLDWYSCLLLKIPAMIGLVMSLHATIVIVSNLVGDPARIAHIKELQQESSNFLVAHHFLCVFIFFLSMIFCRIFSDFQDESQSELQVYIWDDINYLHFLELIPGKALRVAERETRLFCKGNRRRHIDKISDFLTVESYDEWKLASSYWRIHRILKFVFLALFLFFGYMFYHNVCVKAQTNFMPIFFDFVYLYTTFVSWKLFRIVSRQLYVMQCVIDSYYYLPDNCPWYLWGVVAGPGVRKFNSQLRNFEKLHSEEILAYKKRLEEEEQEKERLEKEERQKMIMEQYGNKGTNESVTEQTDDSSAGNS